MKITNAEKWALHKAIDGEFGKKNSKHRNRTFLVQGVRLAPMDNSAEAIRMAKERAEILGYNFEKKLQDKG